MRIKKLELVGFKSFKDRTVIHFDAGITGIVGPNGCGKSNIVDALVWVMGEMSAKHLRGSSMEDVIFAGSEAYAPLGLAEVSLTLENDGGPFPAKYASFSEVMVTRRLHRNGESEYLINKESARLKDIQEIFMDTGAGSKGFSIIEQGAIGKIITAKPEDRKSLIEEAAGITKFKVRKKESQRKLQSTDQNLVRLQDITGELKRQIDSLQRQAQRAERYRNLKNQIEDLDLWLASIQYKELSTKAEQAELIFNEAQSQDVSGGTDLSGMQSDLETRRLTLLEQEKKVEQLQGMHYELQSQVQKKEMQLQELRFEIEQGRRNEQMTGTLLQEQKAREELLDRDFQELTQKAESLKGLVESLKLEFEEKNSVYEEHQSRVQEIDEELTSKRREMFAVGQSVSAVDAKVQSMQAQLDDLQSRREHQESLHQELIGKVEEFKQRRLKVENQYEKERQLGFDLSQDVDSFEANKKVLQRDLEEKRIEVDQFKDSLNQVTSRLYGLESLHGNFEGFEEGVKSVMHWQKARAEQQLRADGSVEVSFQPVSEVVEVPSEFEVAMEAALGTKLQMLLSTNESSAVEAVDHLKTSKTGRTSFFNTPWAAKIDSESIASPTGVVAILKDVIRCSEEFRPTVQHLLGDFAVVEDIRAALALRPEYPGWSFVTIEGDTLSAEGVLTGGARETAESGVLKRRREIKELTQQKEEWSGKLVLAQAAMKKIEQQLQNVVNDFEGAQKRRQEQEIRIAELKKDLERAETEVNNAEYAVERQEKEVQKIVLQHQSLEERYSELEQNLQEARLKKAELEDSIQTLDQELAQNKLGFEGLQNQVMELKVDFVSKSQELDGVQKQLQSVDKMLTDLRGQLSRMSEESSKNATSLTANQWQMEEERRDLEKLIVAVEEARQHLALARDQYEQESADTRELEESVQTLQRDRHQLQMRMNESKLQLEQARMKEQYLRDQIRERYMLELPDVLPRFEGREGDTVGAESELKELREKISKIGEVNLSAIEEYEETSKRYEFLVQQQNDLQEAKEQLRRVIDRINKICSKRFKETFDLVNERFTKVFPVLFGGGEARLELHEDPETQEMGIEIIAKPPGKKMQSVTLMSGGEKALTAVALIFAIFLVKPSPYCLLDEVDAPLDDANVYRFNDLVREMAKRSQIIVVTHNKHTMEVAKKLYGVTMQERGVSTMVSVSLQDAARNFGDV
ncbi:MAG: chromosome segregation protein [Pseudomonadota bacterium]|jgi:chromosome segregation protein